MLSNRRRAPTTIPVRVSAKCARLRFHGCEPEYIRTVCKARCCESSVSPTGTMIAIPRAEQPRIRALGGRIKDGLLQSDPGCRKCPFKTAVDLCSLHDTKAKPTACVVSPFMLNANGTLVIRNRYKLLVCYDAGPRLPAYKAFRDSLVLLFGETQTKRITDHLDNGGGDIIVQIDAALAALLRENATIHASADRKQK